MKRTIFLTLSLLLTMVVRAGDVTPEQALQEAQAFMQKQMATGANTHRVQQALSSLKMEGRVNGLYVFNTDDDNGYVIVSDDDRTEAVLGYADNGHLDLDNMPENMRVWLQGYADEIAWIRANNIQPATTNDVSRRASAVKKPVAPLVPSQWTQIAPFNDLCPEYMPGVKATAGCVAIAMAQCMYATELRVGSTTTYTTATIPSYVSGTRGYVIDSIPAGTPINWSNMIPNYSNGCTKAQAKAIAELAYYCGVAVQMDYALDDAGASGASISRVVDALKYFGYSSTARFVERDFYSYKEWINMIYNELRQGHPVYYAAYKTIGAGHAFVCDGYQPEDYFHINWGWADNNDGYFKLTVLEPATEGVGGNNAPGGYTCRQDAILGIQKLEETGTVLELTPNDINLSIDSVSFGTNMTQGLPIDVTFFVKNNGLEEFAGTIYMGICDNEEDMSPYEYITCQAIIPPTESRVCQFSFVPEKSGKYHVIPYCAYDEFYIQDFGLCYELDVAEGDVKELPYSNNIELGYSVSIENEYKVYDAEKNDVNVFGNTFRGKLTVTNPDTTTNFDGVYLCRVILSQTGEEVFLFFTRIIVPAGGSYDIPIEFTGMSYRDYYRVEMNYLTDTGWRDWKTVAYIYNMPTIVTTMPDGTEINVSPKSETLQPAGTYTVPAGATSVDLRETGITTLNTEGCTPNTLYLFDTTDKVPDGLTNVVLYDRGIRKYAADTITLTNSYSFASPVDFTASHIEFTYNNNRWADENGGWNTLILPFNVDSVTADGARIDWFRNGTEGDKQFWLKEFSGDDPDVVYFDDLSGSMTAYTPYLIALPGDHWGTAYDLSKKTIKFIGSGEVKKSTTEKLTAGNYIYMGNTARDSTANIYTLNAAGTQFELGNGSAPFCAYFKPISFDPNMLRLNIGCQDLTLSVREVENKAPSASAWYTLDGRRLNSKPNTKPNTKGIYIQNGQKYIVK